MESIAKIRRMYHINNKGIKTIAKELNISKNTVKKVIRSDATKFELTKHIKSKPVLGGHIVRLHQLLEENKKEPLRRRMTFSSQQAARYQKSFNWPECICL